MKHLLSGLLLVLSLIANTTAAYAVELMPAQNVVPVGGGCAGTLNIAVTCTWEPSRGYSLATFYLDYVNFLGGGGATGYTMAIEESYNTPSSPASWYQVATQSVVGGIITVTPSTVTRVFPAGASERLAWTIGVNASAVRITIIGTGAPNVSDRISGALRIAYP